MSKDAPLHLTINTCYEDVFDGDALSIMLTTPEGELALRARHENAMYAVKAGEIIVKTKAEDLRFTTNGGVLQMYENRAVLLTSFAAISSEYKAKQNAHGAKRAKRDSEEKKSEAELQRVQMKLQQTLSQQ